MRHKKAHLKAGDTTFGSGQQVARQKKQAPRLCCQRCGRHATLHADLAGGRELRVCGDCRVARSENIEKIARRCAEAEQKVLKKRR